MRLTLARWSLILVLALGLTAPLAAQTGVRLDSSVVEARPVPNDALDAYRSDPAFAYDREPPPAVSFGDIVWRWIMRNIIGPFLSATTPGTRSWLFYGLLAAILLFAGYKLFGADRQGVFQRRTAAPLDRALAEEGIASVDLGALAAQAEREGRFREAVRLLYLQTLQRLAADGRIQWAADKTNRAYVAELRGSGLERAFETVTRLFERAWYGSLPVDASTFAEARAFFGAFQRDAATTSAARRR